MEQAQLQHAHSADIQEEHFFFFFSFSKRKTRGASLTTSIFGHQYNPNTIISPLYLNYYLRLAPQFLVIILTKSRDNILNTE